METLLERRRRDLVVGLALLGLALYAWLVLFLWAAAPAYAQEASPSAPVGDVLTVSQTGVALLTGLVLPLVLGLLIKATNPEWVKVVGGILVAFVAALVTEAIRDDGTAVLSWDMLVTTALIYIPQILSYFGIWQPLAQGDLNGKLGPGVIPIEKRAPAPPQP